MGPAKISTSRAFPFGGGNFMDTTDKYLDDAQDAAADQSQDASGTSGDTSGDAQQASKDASTGTYTKADIDKAVNDALAQDGRTEAHLKTRQSEIDARLEEVAAWQRRKDEEEEESARDNPDAL